MLSLPPSIRIFVHTLPTDMRRGFNGFSAIVSQAFGRLCRREELSTLCKNPKYYRNSLPAKLLTSHYPGPLCDFADTLLRDLFERHWPKKSPCGSPPKLLYRRTAALARFRLIAAWPRSLTSNP